MNKRFTTMVSNVSNEVNDTTNAFKSIVTEYINNNYFKALQLINFDKVRPDYTFQTVAGQQEYVMPSDFGHELSVRDVTNGLELGHIDLQRLITDFPSSISSEGSPARYYILEDRVHTQPTSASTLSVVSSSTSDTTQKVLIRGIASGVEVSEEVTLTGTTVATSSNSYTRVLSISKDGNTVGYTTITSNASAVTIAVLAPKVLTSYYKKMCLHYVPSEVLTIAVPYIIRPLPLIEDSDYPIVDIADIIELGAKADAWRYKRMFAKAASFDSMFMSAIADYVYHAENKPNQPVQFKPSVYNKDNLY